MWAAASRTDDSPRKGVAPREGALQVPGSYSDFSNSDIESNTGEPQDVVSAVRNGSIMSGAARSGPSKYWGLPRIHGYSYAVQAAGFSEETSAPTSRVSLVSAWGPHKPQLG